MSVIQQMRTVAEALKLQNVEGGPVFLKQFEEDFELYDVDLLENFYTEGDKLIWEVRGDGCGTRMYNTKSELGLGEFEKTALKDSRFFAIELTGQDQGNLKTLSYDEAINYYKNTHVPGTPEPHRPSIQYMIKEALGMDTDKPLHYELLNGLNLTPGEDIYLQFSADFNRRSIQCLMAKPDIKEDEPGVSRTKEDTGRYYLPPDLKVLDKVEKPLHLKIVPGRDPVYGKCEVVSQKLFQAAVKKVSDKSKKQEPGLSV